MNDIKFVKINNQFINEIIDLDMKAFGSNVPISTDELLLLNDGKYGQIFGLKIEKTLVGYAILQFKSIDNPIIKYSKSISAKELYVHTIAIEPKYQGKGLGTLFLDYIKDYSIVNGFEYLTARAYPFNIPSLILFLNKLRMTSQLLINDCYGKLIDRFEMRLHLNVNESNNYRKRLSKEIFIPKSISGTIYTLEVRNSIQNLLNSGFKLSGVNSHKFGRNSLNFIKE